MTIDTDVIKIHEKQKQENNEYRIQNERIFEGKYSREWNGVATDRHYY